MPSLQWYRARAASMTAPELIYRAAQFFKSQQERLPRPVGPWVSPSDVIERASSPKLGMPSKPGLWDDRLGAAFKRNFVDEAEALQQRADEIVTGRLTLFGHEIVEWPRIPDWHRDPTSGAAWPRRRFYADVDFRSGGAKRIWEPARHQHLATLAQAYAVHRDDRYRHYLYDQLQHWLDNDSVARGVHWTSGIEIALRLVSWSWILACAPPAGDAEDIRLAWSTAIINSGTYLSRHLSRFSSANNHLIAEALGLIAASVLAPFWPTAPEWRSRGWEILEEEAQKQVHPDGVPAEQATHYLGFTTDLLLMAQVLDPSWRSTRAMNERLEKVGEFVLACADDALQLPAIGDHDSGYVFKPFGQPLDWRGRLGIMAATFGRSDFKFAVDTLTAGAWLLLSDHSRNCFAQTPRTITRMTSRAFPDGGYWVLRGHTGQRPVLVFDCGPLGYPSIAAHGHADCLSVTLSLNGRSVLVDPGAYVYHEKPVWRDYFRSTRAHNTLSVNGADQSQQTGPMMWGARAHPSHVAFSQSEAFDWVEGEHDGYAKSSRSLIHRRAIAMFRSTYVLIVDRVSSQQPIPVLINYQFAPQAAVEQKDSLIYGAVGDAELVIVPPANSVGSVVKGQLNPPAGWVSPQLGLKYPAAAAMIRATTQQDTPLVTMIWFGAAEPPLLEQQPNGNDLVIRVITPEWADQLVIDVSASGRSSMLKAFHINPAAHEEEAVRTCAV
jgi:heparinase II/III-like protein